MSATELETKLRELAQDHDLIACGDHVIVAQAADALARLEKLEAGLRERIGAWRRWADGPGASMTEAETARWCAEGVKSLLSTPAPEASGWVSVKERMPGEDLPGESCGVLVWAAGVRALAYWNFDHKQWFNSETGKRIYGVTHWHPIPALPAATKMEVGA